MKGQKQQGRSIPRGKGSFDETRWRGKKKERKKHRKLKKGKSARQSTTLDEVEEIIRHFVLAHEDSDESNTPTSLSLPPLRRKVRRHVHMIAGNPVTHT